MGVITLVTIDYGRIYGPLPKSSVITDPVSHIGSLTNQNACQRITLQVNPDEAKELNEPMEWLCYIHPAKTEDEQNMEAYIKEGQIYYRALRMIKAHEELLIWYSKDFAMLIGIPEIQRPINGEPENYSCPYCGENFDYPFPLRAHVRFRCPQRRVWSHADNFTKIAVHKKERRSPPSSAGREKTKDTGSLGTKSRTSLTDYRGLKREGSAIHETDCSPEKRQERERHGSSSKTLTPEPKDKSFDCNQNIKSNGFSSEDGHSAFRKVDKLTSGSYNRASPLEPPVPVSSRHLKRGLSLVPPSSMAGPMPALAGHGDPQSNLFLDSRLPVYPMMPHLHPAMVHLPRPGMFGGIPMGAAVISGGISQPMKTKRDESEGDLKNIENSNPSLLSSSKPPVMFDKPRNPYSAIRTINPMMEKMLHPSSQTAMHSPLSSVNVFQNCCAQCSATFRMTSDLVYHMRSHHKREFDPMKRKREEKLRCNICSESFRERHHLTRHMTSHL